MTQEFYFSRGRRWKALGGGILACLAIVLFFSPPFPETGEWGRGVIIYTLMLLFFFGYGLLLLSLWRRVNDAVRVDKQTITYVSRQTGQQQLTWEQVDEIREQNSLCQQLVLSGTQQGGAIRLAYDLQNANQLIQSIVDSVPHIRARYREQKQFERSWVIRLSYVLFPVVSGVFCWGAEASWLLWGIVFGSVSIINGIFYLWEVERVEVCAEHLSLDYPFRRRHVPYSDISGVRLELSSVREVPIFFNWDPDAQLLAVFVEVKNKKAIRLTCLNAGALALYESLKATWEDAKVSSEN